MTANSLLQLALFLIVLVALVKPLGWYMARVYQGQPCGLDRLLGWLERSLYRLGGTTADAEMTWQQYAIAMLLFNMIHHGAMHLGQAWGLLKSSGVTDDGFEVLVRG